jgi:hypothetical protein
VAQASAKIHFVNGDELVVRAAAEKVLEELEAKPATNGLVGITDGKGKVFLRVDQVAYVRAITPADGSDETRL